MPCEAPTPVVPAMEGGDSTITSPSPFTSPALTPAPEPVPSAFDLPFVYLGVSASSQLDEEAISVAKYVAEVEKKYPNGGISGVIVNVDDLIDSDNKANTGKSRDRGSPFKEGMGAFSLSEDSHFYQTWGFLRDNFHKMSNLVENNRFHLDLDAEEPLVSSIPTQSRIHSAYRNLLLKFLGVVLSRPGSSNQRTEIENLLEYLHGYFKNARYLPGIADLGREVEKLLYLLNDAKENKNSVYLLLQNSSHFCVVAAALSFLQVVGTLREALSIFVIENSIAHPACDFVVDISDYLNNVEKALFTGSLRMDREAKFYYPAFTKLLNQIGFYARRASEYAANANMAM